MKVSSKLVAGGSAIDGSEPIRFMGLYNFSAADPITRQNWDVGSAKIPYLTHD